MTPRKPAPLIKQGRAYCPICKTIRLRVRGCNKEDFCHRCGYTYPWPKCL